MSLVAAIVVGVPIGVGIGWLVWNFWNNNRLLDSRLAVGDMGSAFVDKLQGFRGDKSACW